MDRKTFIQHAFKATVGKGASLLADNPVTEALERLAEEPKAKQRPPGAVPDEEGFLGKCTGCDACMIACPANAIVVEDLDRRDPFLYPDENSCIHCQGYPCVAACPTAALDEANGYCPRFL